MYLFYNDGCFFVFLSAITFQWVKNKNTHYSSFKMRRTKQKNNKIKKNENFGVT